MMMQRMFGLFCALSIASLIARYMSCVIAFFFSGRRSVITRVASSSDTMRCSVMTAVPGAGGDAAAGEYFGYILHDPCEAPSRRSGFFRGMIRKSGLRFSEGDHAQTNSEGRCH